MAMSVRWVGSPDVRPRVALYKLSLRSTELNGNEAATKATVMSTSQWWGILRNALAHGGVAEDRTTASVPMLLLPPARFSMRNY
jgi:hypothetical protein